MKVKGFCSTRSLTCRWRWARISRRNARLRSDTELALNGQQHKITRHQRPNSRPFARRELAQCNQYRWLDYHRLLLAVILLMSGGAGNKCADCREMLRRFPSSRKTEINLNRLGRNQRMRPDVGDTAAAFSSETVPASDPCAIPICCSSAAGSDRQQKAPPTVSILFGNFQNSLTVPSRTYASLNTRQRSGPSKEMKNCESRWRWCPQLADRAQGFPFSPPAAHLSR